MSRTHRRAAYTLAGLVVLVGIIALLITVLWPSLSRARGQAKPVQCLSNMRQIGGTLTMFVNENMGDVPNALFNYGPRPGI